MEKPAQLPACGHWFLDLCPATRTAAEQHARTQIRQRLTTLESEIEYYRKRRDRIANHYRLQMRHMLLGQLEALDRPLPSRGLFAGSSIDKIVTEWLADPSVVDDVTHDLSTATTQNAA